jgi:hypothetical protein
MQDYVAWCSDDLSIIEWCDRWQLVDNVDILHVKKIALNDL